MSSSRQKRLFRFENPLIQKLGRDFFKTVPTLPGVYYMLGPNGGILYIGKAKNLRNRINSYKNATPQTVTRKIMRMLHLVHKIHWELCETEIKALLRENTLLRQHRPPFNVLNTRPETYYFLGITEGQSLSILLTTNPNAEAQTLYGAFKGRRRVRESYAALLRLLWFAHTKATGFELLTQIPTCLVKNTPLYTYEFQNSHFDGMQATWMQHLHKFLQGKSKLFLRELTTKLLTQDHLPRFVYQLIETDLQQLNEFYKLGPRRNYKLIRLNKLDTFLIGQAQLDDLLLHFKMGKQTSGNET